MTKEEVVSQVAQEAGCTKVLAARVLRSTLDLITRELAAGGSVRFSGFGVFKTQRRSPRTGRDLSSDSPVPIPGRTVPVFKPGKGLLSAVSDPAKGGVFHSDD